MKLTDVAVKNCKGTVTESLGRGLGAIEFKQQTGKVTAYFRYYRDKKSPVRILIARYGKPAGMSLLEIRTKAGELAKMRREIAPTDLKIHLDRQRMSGGSFADLLNAYIDDLRARGKISVNVVEDSLRRDVIKANPSLARIPARDVMPMDIVTLCARVHNRGGVAVANLLRAYLHAAFNYGAKADHDHTRPTDSPTFGLTTNPVSITKSNRSAIKPGQRVLTHDELRALWHGVDKAYGVGSLRAALVRFCIATGGQRPQQVIRTTWKDYNREEKTITLINWKNGGRSHVVPLSDRAQGILDSLHPAFDWPFAFWDRSHMTISAASASINRYLKANPDTEWFTFRDLRRTIKNLLIDAGVDRDSRNLLQSHGLTGIDFKHYDRHNHLPEKWAAMAKYDELLGSILSEDF